MSSKRIVTLVVVDSGGNLLGALPPFTVDRPYWQEVDDVIAGARDNFGINLSILRLLSTEPSSPPGGAVTYIAQAHGSPSSGLNPVEIELNDHPNRAAYAKVGGPAASLAWASANAPSPVESSYQQRTWNLSAVWRLQTQSNTLWLKEVPEFLAHETAVLGWLNRSAHSSIAAPQIATDGRRMLLGHIPGDDLYDADLSIRSSIAKSMHAVQVKAAAAVGELIELGVPDRRSESFLEFLAHALGTAHEDPSLAAFIASMQSRLDDINACGLPATLVHGDLHPGNARGDADSQVLIDWGDSFVGNPGFDILRLAEGLNPWETTALISAWAARWQAFAPDSKPLRALSLLRPIAALRHAAVYADFLTKIEPTEWPYHEADVPQWLQRATRLIE